MHPALDTFCRAMGTRRPWQGLAKLTGLGLLIGTVVWVAAQSQVTSPIGSYLELGGQVTGPATSPTLNSTLDLSGNDQVRWTSYFQSKLDGPHETEGVLDIPPGHTWLAGSVRKPANVSMQWLVNGQWTTTEPANGSAVTQVKWSYAPPSVLSSTSSTPTAPYMWNLGDAFRLIPYKDKMFVAMRADGVVNSSGNFGSLDSGYLKCRMAQSGGTPCASPADPPNTWVPQQLPMQGLSFADKEGERVRWSGNTRTWRSSTMPLEIVNYDTGEMFMGMEKADGSGNYVVCTNLDTFTHCGQWKVSEGKVPGAAPIINLSSVGSKYFMMVDGLGTVVCFDSVSRSECGRTRYLGAYDHEYQLATQSISLGGKLFIHNPRTSQLYCHDPDRQAPCRYWQAEGTPLGANSYSQGIYPYLNTDGSPKGVCSPMKRCVDFEGLEFNAGPNYSGVYLQEMHPGFHHIDSMVGSRMFSRYGPLVRCFDFANDNTCGWSSLPRDAYHPSFPGELYGMLHTYTARVDPTRPNCVLIVGKNGQADLLDTNSLRPFTEYAPHKPCGGSTSSNLPDVDVSPAVGLQCDGTRTKVQGWDQVRLSSSLPWGGANGLSGVTVTLKDANGTTLPARLNPVRQMPYGSYNLDISDIPYADFPHLKVSFTLVSPSGLQARGKAGADVTWKGDPMQVCVGTQAPPAPDCQTVATLNVKSTLLGSSVSEALTVSKVLSPGGTSTGFSALASPTSQRAVLSDKGPRDPKTSVVQGRWALQQFSGDLWAFGLTPTGQIDSSGYLSAQAATAAPDARPMFTAGVAANGVQPVQPLTWANLSAGQQAALNQGLSGQADTLGAARLAYLRGSDGGFRPRGGKSLGPVINSSPAVLLPTATLSLNERSYPGYTAYRAAVTRPHPIALFGGNDGALHAYEVRSGELREAWSFVPDVMLRRAANYADADMAGIRANPYFVDNIPMVGHVNAGAALGWRAVAVMTYGRGARAITALDVTKADLGQGAGVLFEYSNVSDPALKDLGYIISQPLSNNALVSQQLVQLAHGTGAHAGRRSAVLVGNGIHSNDGNGGAAASGTGKAVLYAFYLDQDGAERWQRWAVDELWAGAASEPGLSVNNGLSTPTPVDVDGDGRIDLVYAGDLQGNVWRFDVRNPAAARVTRLFKTEAQQPVTQAPFVTANPLAAGCGSADADGAGAEAGTAAKRCWQVVFATGAAISPLQGSANVATQSIYGVLDKGTGATVARGQLTSLPFALNQVVNGVEYRALQPTTVDYQGGALGWVLDLQAFEHGVGAPRVQPTGLVMFSSVRPVTPDRAVNVCIGPRSWLNEVDPLHGYSALVPFDINGDGQINAQDRLNPDSAQALSPAGMAVSGGQFGPPAVLQAASTQAQQMSLLLPSLGQDTGQANSWSGGPGQGGGSSPAPGSNSTALTHAKPAKLGRMTWREVY